MIVTVVWPGWLELDSLTPDDVPDITEMAARVATQQSHGLFVAAFNGNTPAVVSTLSSGTYGPYAVFPTTREAKSMPSTKGWGTGITAVLRQLSSRFWHPGTDAPVVLWQPSNEGQAAGIIQRHWRSPLSWVLLVQRGGFESLREWLTSARIGDVERRRDLAWLQEPPDANRSLSMVSYNGAFFDMRVRADLYECIVELLRQKCTVKFFWSDEFK